VMGDVDNSSAFGIKILLSVGLLPPLSCRNLMLSKYLHDGNDVAAAPERVSSFLLSRHFFKVSLRFVKVF